MRHARARSARRERVRAMLAPRASPEVRCRLAAPPTYSRERRRPAHVTNALKEHPRWSNRTRVSNLACARERELGHGLRATLLLLGLHLHQLLLGQAFGRAVRARRSQAVLARAQRAIRLVRTDAGERASPRRGAAIRTVEARALRVRRSHGRRDGRHADAGSLHTPLLSPRGGARKSVCFTMPLSGPIGITPALL